MEIININLPAQMFAQLAQTVAPIAEGRKWPFTKMDVSFEPTGKIQEQTQALHATFHKGGKSAKVRFALVAGHIKGPAFIPAGSADEAWLPFNPQMITLQ